MRKSIRVTDEMELKYIAKMFYVMSRACRKHFEALEKQSDDGFIDSIKIPNPTWGFETTFEDGRKFQLVLELKEVKEDD